MTGPATSSLGAWVAGRTPPVPSSFGPRLRLDDPHRPGATPGQRIEGLVEETRSALARAAARKATDREGAFDLLAADAWATWASEAALEMEDPVATLTELAIRLSDAAR